MSAVAFLFNEVRYKLGGYVIDHNDNPGITLFCISKTNFVVQLCEIIVTILMLLYGLIAYLLNQSINVGFQMQRPPRTSIEIKSSEVA